MSEVMDRTYHIIKAHKECAPYNREDDGREECADETFYSLLRRELNERGPTDSDPWLFRSEKKLKDFKSIMLHVPQMYANISLQITREAGTQNQMRPSRMLLTMK